MPGLSGTETLPRILALRPDQALLMCSGHGDDAMMKLAAGHASVLTLRKPFTLDELEEKLGALVLLSR